MQHKEIALMGQKIAYYESAGKGQPVLFIHGNSMSGLCFQKQLTSALGEQYRLVAMDLPGHGKSAPAEDPGSAYTLPAFADIVTEFAKSLALDNAVLVGWSLGGHVLLEAIGRMQKAAGLMIFGAPPAGKPLGTETFLPNPLFPLAFKNELTNEEVCALTASFFKPGSHLPEFFFEDMRRTDGRAREALGVSIAQGNYSNEVNVIADLNKPLAIVHGEQDYVANLSYMKLLGIPTLWKGAIQVIPDSGHAPHWEQPEKFNSLLRAFIED